MDMSRRLLKMKTATSALASSGINERSRLNTLHNVLNHLCLSHRMREINTQYPDITWMNVHVYDSVCVLKYSSFTNGSFILTHYSSLHSTQSSTAVLCQRNQNSMLLFCSHCCSVYTVYSMLTFCMHGICRWHSANVHCTTRDIGYCIPQCNAFNHSSAIN